MVYKNPMRKSRIKRITREIATLDDFLYEFHKDDDRFLYMSSLERKRDDVVRSAVLQMHTAIEDLMTQMLFSGVLGAERRSTRRKRRHTKRGQAMDRLLNNLGFDKKLDFAILVGVIDTRARNGLKC